jgi:hypothetical protein
LESGGYALPIPHDVLIARDIASPRPILKPQEIPNLLPFLVHEEANVQKTGQREIKIYPQVKSFSALVCNL